MSNNNSVGKKLDQIPATYDSMYETGGYGGSYILPYKRTWFYPMYREVLAQLISNNTAATLEVGCGSGAFAHMLMVKTNIAYFGFDFSEKAIDLAIRRTSRSEILFVGDALDKKCYEGDFDTVVCTEVLEHIERDRDVIALWPKGTFCVCSVPNFDSPSHVRYFNSINEVIGRYGDLIQIDGVKRIKKPALPDISLRSKLQALIWYRNRPNRFLAVLGLGSFESRGGWFVFWGYRI